MISELMAMMLMTTKPVMVDVDVPKEPIELMEVSSRNSWVTMASHYGVGDGYHGRIAADGSRFNAYGFTAAHNTLPFGTRVRVTNLSNGRSVVVKITDRGGFNSLGRGIDLSYGAAKAIGGVRAGVFKVRIEVLN